MLEALATDIGTSWEGGRRAQTSLFQLGLEVHIDDLVDLDAVLEIERAVAPGGPQLVESRALFPPVLRLDELDEVARQAIRYDTGAEDGLVVEVDEVAQANAGVAGLRVLGREGLELGVHAAIEIAHEEVRPELVKNVHVVMALATRGGFALPQSAGAEGQVRLVRKFVGEVFRWRILVLDPIHGHRRSGLRAGEGAERQRAERPRRVRLSITMESLAYRIEALCKSKTDVSAARSPLMMTGDVRSLEPLRLGSA